MARQTAPKLTRERVTQGARGFATWSATPTGLAWLFFIGLVLRLWLARGGGFPFDVGTFSAWADRLATVGVRRFYADPHYFVDYPPGFMYVLLVLGKISRLMSGGAPSTFLIKLPGILSDLGLAWVVGSLAAGLTPRGMQQRLPVRGIAVSAVLFNPAVFFVSAVWGQVDSLPALIALAAFVLLGTGEPTRSREAGGVALLALALVTKPQTAFVLPLAALVLVWRHLRGALADATHEAILGASLRLAGLAVIGLGTGLALVAPFGLGLGGWFHFYTHAAGTYPYTSVWAFNLWGALGFWRRDAPGPGVFRVLGVPALYVGIALLAAGTVLLLSRAWRSLRRGQVEGRVLVFGGAAMTCLAFAVLTRIHERYLFLALACLAPLIGYRRLRRSLIALSLLYFVNVYFAYVYYVEYVKRHAIRIPGYNLLYGTLQDSAQRKLISLGTGVLCLVVAWRGWRWLEARPDEEEETAEQGTLAFVPPHAQRVGAAEVGARLRLELHPVARRGAALASVVFVLVLATRLAGLGSPPGMYFDEVYHARTAGEYLQHKEVYEWTHPPLAKELMALSLKGLSGFGVHGRSRPPRGLASGVSASDGSRVMWAAPSGSFTGTLWTGSFTETCGVAAGERALPLDVVPSAIAPLPNGAVVGGTGAAGPALTRVVGGSATTVPLPGRPRRVAAVGGTSFVLTDSGSLLVVGADRGVRTIGTGAADIWAVQEDQLVWASFPGSNTVTSYGADGGQRDSVRVQGRPRAIGASADADRVLAADGSSSRVESIDTEAKTRTDQLLGPAPDRFAEVAETGLLWAANGRDLRVIEPRGLAVIGRARLDAPPVAIMGDMREHRLVAVTARDVECAWGRNTFAWRFGSAVFGAVMTAVVLLIALRLFGNAGVALLSAAFVALDGLAFVMSRIAMNDSYAAAFLFTAWFCALSCLYRWGRAEADGARSRRAALGWLVATGATAGLAAASKWVGLYAMAGIILLFAWDFVTHGREGTAGIAGPPVLSFTAAGASLVALPLVLYVLTYIPYFQLGHSFADFLRLQKAMYDYHAHLKATHPYGSPWYMWPVGRKAVWLYLGTHGAKRAEIWTVANPVVFLGGLVGVAAVAVAAWRRRSLTLGFVPLAALIQYLPWTTVHRVTFLYHYLPDVPFLAMGLAWWLVVGRKGVKRRNLEIAVVLGATLLVFLLILPMTDGWFVAPSYQQSVRSWLSWMF